MAAPTAPPTGSSTARNALVVIAVILAGAALRWMTDIVTPLLLAMFLAVMVDGFARVIRRRVPRAGPRVAVIAAITISMILFAVAAFIVASNAGGFLLTLAGAQPKLTAMVEHVAQGVGPKAAQSVNQTFSHFDPTQYLGVVAQGLQGVASSAIFVLVYLGFLIASRHAFERKAVKLFHGRGERAEALHVFVRVRDGVERYLWIQTVTGLIIAAVSWLMMVVIGLDNAFFWAFLIFILNYIPIVGAVAAIVLPAIFALVQFDGYTRGALLLGGLWLITFVVGNILLPRMQGDSLNMDPLVVLLSLAFWGAIWGLPGMFLSTPLTVLAMVILAQFDGSRWIAVLLSADGDPQGLGRGSERSPDEDAQTPGIHGRRRARRRLIG
ncbi:MAG: AI-2E family transporter [Caulobacteraceae bacterium]